MESVGKCLLFYLKYATEMERLYEADEPNVEGLDDADRIIEKVIRVGETASAEAEGLLMSCAAVVESHFRSIGAIKKCRWNVRNKWDVEYLVTPSVGHDGRFRVGVCIDTAQSALMPWMWCRRRTQPVATALGEVLDSVEIGIPTWDADVIAIDRIQIGVPESIDVVIPSGALVERVAQSFARIDKATLDRIGNIVAR